MLPDPTKRSEMKSIGRRARLVLPEEAQDERDPLVVEQLQALSFGARAGNLLRLVNVVSVGDITDVVGVVLVTRGEHRRHPTLDLLRAELPVGDNGGEYIEENHGVAIVKSIDEIIRVSLRRLILTGKTRNAFQQEKRHTST